MALLGGAARLFGPLAGVIPLVILFEVLSARFPNTFSILLGVTFMVIVYFLPDGVAGWIPSACGACKGPTHEHAACASPDLTRAFGGLVAVDELRSRVGRGEIVGLIGPNGSGKTTALNLISGALVPDAGSIQFRGDGSCAACRRTASRASASRARSSWCACSTA